MSSLAESGIDLGRKGVVWLGGRPLAVERNGEQRAVARLRKESVVGPPVVGTLFGADFSPTAEQPGTLIAGGRRKKDSLEAIDRWYRRQARRRIEEVTASESERLDLYPKKISIRDQKTRWGSCSTSGTLSFNWRLIIGPEHALRYVVIHELVHIRRHDHSRKFWEALTEALPEWKHSAIWLRTNERALTAYRPKI